MHDLMAGRSDIQLAIKTCLKLREECGRESYDLKHGDNTVFIYLVMSSCVIL